MFTLRSASIRVRFVPIALVALAGCSSDSLWAAARVEPEPGGPIWVDGDLREWRTDEAARVDADSLPVRLSFVSAGPDGGGVRPDDPGVFTLQGAPNSSAVLLDVDANAATGARTRVDASSPELGVDLEIEFSPWDASKARPGVGVAVWRLNAAGERVRVAPEDVEVFFAPTYAATWYEVRLSRHALALQEAILAPGLFSSGALRGSAVLREGERIVASADVFQVDCPPLGAAPRADVAIPGRPERGMRVVSYNVLRSAPLTHPEVFRRVFDALDPDIVLLQEWDRGDAQAIESWFRTMLPGETAWSARVGPAGVAIVSRWPLLPAAPEVVKVPGEERPVRFVAARVDSPFGPVAVASVHLKCCGTKDSAEDRRRLAEGRAISAAWQEALSGPESPQLRVIAGDMNLVGSRPPLDALRAGLDADGTDLALSVPWLLGDRAMYTWADPGTPFTPGRLDYVLYGDAALSAASAFVLDASRLSDEALARAGLQRSDTTGSDHLPVVVDLVPLR